MKYIYYFIIILAIANGIFNATKLDFNGLLKEESQIAVISIIGTLCVIILMIIMLISKKIDQKVNNQ